jgi:hypothetical protein
MKWHYSYYYDSHPFVLILSKFISFCSFHLLPLNKTVLYMIIDYL